MAEKQNPNFLKGHKFDLKQARLDLYRLACYFEASRPLAELGQAEGSPNECFIDSLPREFFEDEVSRILLQTAIVLRIVDDESEADREERNPFICGELEQNGDTGSLPLREACNKIIHARKINFDTDTLPLGSSEGERNYFLNPYVYLYGSQGNKHWKAIIRVRDFLSHGSRLLRARTLSEFIEWEKQYGRT